MISASTTWRTTPNIGTKKSSVFESVRRQSSNFFATSDVGRARTADKAFHPGSWILITAIPKTKSFALAAGHALLKSRQVLLAEVAKCDIVCANCHAIRTYSWIKSENVFASRAPGVSRYIERKTAYRKDQAKLLAELRTVPCLDCNLTFPYFVMQFDHRDATNKRYVVTQMIGRAGTGTILAEVAKCDIVCANCHRDRSYRRRTASAGVL